MLSIIMNFSLYTKVFSQAVSGKLFGAKSSSDLEKKKTFRLAQSTISDFASEVVTFSSQYGTDASISYVVSNLQGPSHVFPSYGDRAEACVFRTYGQWWKECPSAASPIVKQPGAPDDTDDFVDLHFPQECYPTELLLFETYNPGALVRISAANFSPQSELDDEASSSAAATTTKRWIVLWEAAPSRAPCESRELRIVLAPCPFRTDFLRLELIHDHLEYYHETDAVQIHGRYEPYCDSRHEVLRQVSQEQTAVDSLIPAAERLTLRNPHCLELPDELLLEVFRRLDIRQRGRAACVSRQFRRCAYDPLLYTRLNMRYLWPMLNDQCLASLSQTARLSRTTHLDLSFCGLHQLITPAGWRSLFAGLSCELQVLRLAACQSLTEPVLKLALQRFRKLKDIDLSSVPGCLGTETFSALSELRRLKLYRACPATADVMSVCRLNPQLQHLNLGACRQLNADLLIPVLVESCRQLVSIDLWRNRSLTPEGLDALSGGCPLLQEVDVGWCKELQRNDSSCLSRLCERCPGLRKICWTSIRTVKDSDLEAVGKYCKQLEQLDILGASNVTEKGVSSVLHGCPSLRLFDVSFCNRLSRVYVDGLRRSFPLVSFKQSFQA